MIGTLDDDQLAALTVAAVRQIENAPWRSYTGLADTAVQIEGGTADA